MFQKVSKVACLSKNFILLFAVLVFTGCSLLKKDQNTSENPVSLPEQKNEVASLVLFFPKTDTTGISKMKLEVEEKSKNMNQSIDQILIGLSKPLDGSMQPVFPEKFELYGTFLDKDMLYLDFAAGIQKANYPSIQMEQLALEAFLSTIKANFPYVQQVKFLSEHEDTQVIFGHTYAQQPFSLKDL